MGKNFLTPRHPSVRVRNVRGKSGPKSLCLCCFFFPDSRVSQLSCWVGGFGCPFFLGILWDLCTGSLEFVHVNTHSHIPLWCAELKEGQGGNHTQHFKLNPRKDGPLETVVGDPLPSVSEVSCQNLRKTWQEEQVGGWGGAAKRPEVRGVKNYPLTRKHRANNALCPSVIVCYLLRILRLQHPLERNESPLVYPTPKTPQTQTMVWVSPPQTLRPWSEFLLSLINTGSGVVWVWSDFFSDHGLSFLPRGQEHWGRGRRMSIEERRFQGITRETRSFAQKIFQNHVHKS